MRVSIKGINLIKSFEGLKLTAYKAHFSEKYWTIGYGHYGPDVKEGDTCNEAYAETLMKNDLKIFEDRINKALNEDNIVVNQNQYDALISFAYNVGSENLLSSTLWRKLKQRDFEGAANQFLRWNKCGGQILPGLVNRRDKERALFLSKI